MMVDLQVPSPQITFRIRVATKKPEGEMAEETPSRRVAWMIIGGLVGAAVIWVLGTGVAVWRGMEEKIASIFRGDVQITQPIPVPNSASESYRVDFRSKDFDAATAKFCAITLYGTRTIGPNAIQGWCRVWKENGIWMMQSRGGPDPNEPSFCSVTCWK